ncbi:MAG TPA: hypothetical protein VFU06_15285 [Longimicrobiales bacterium]|nr:hypothetical protein [Longimicrobiales bacterium]
MNDTQPGVLQRLWGRIRRTPPVLLVALGAGLAAGLVWGGVELYRTYDYIQHDNDFCLSCHLMVDPFERFSRSAHRDLGCKACHRPTIVTRSTMALTQILENPDSLEAHAYVPNAVCIECHVEGDPEDWRNVAASAGHRVHLESDDASLSELECVQCHSSSVHEFTATDQTCGQAGCHEDQRIVLGEMGNLTIHCATCHSFSAPVVSEDADSVQLALQPQREECLSCHAMRERLADFPLAENDPHNGVCGACHNPHEQETPRAAFESCASAGCHARADTLTPFHRGLDPGVLQNCAQCHDAHVFHAEGQDCRSCHTDVAEPSRVTGGMPSAHRPFGLTGGSVGPVSVSEEEHATSARRVLRMLAALVLPQRAAAQTPQNGRDATLDFDHARHTQVDCLACHSAENTHGQITVTSFNDCRSCHHTGSVVQPCTRCHTSTDMPGGAFDLRRPFRPSVGRAENRTFRFDHAQHADVACATCHREGLELSAARVNCSACHEEHHEASNNCRACHETPAAGAHTRTAHLTCAGSGCHSPAPVQASERTRQLCLSCHQDMVDHQPGRVCVDCHALPAARASAAGGGG